MTRQKAVDGGQVYVGCQAQGLGAERPGFRYKTVVYQGECSREANVYLRDLGVVKLRAPHSSERSVN